MNAHRERLLRISRTRTPTAQDAEDCVQEAMLRCVEFPNLDESRLGAFLTTVTLRLCADRHRERTNEERLRQRLGVRDLDTPSPEDDVCDRSEAAWLASRFGELTPRQQEIVRAREAGLSCAEVASRFRMSYVSVESSLSRARSRFREALAKTMGIVSPSAWRWATALEAATVTAVAVGGLVSTPGVAALPPPAQPPAVVVTQRVTRAEPRMVAPVAARATVRLSRTLPPAPAATQPLLVAKKPPKRPPPDVAVGNYSVGADAQNDDYTTQERLMHCVQYGITTVGGIHCRYPNEG